MKSEKDTGKLFYRLDEVSRIAGLEPKVIERWERDFPEPWGPRTFSLTGLPSHAMVRNEFR